MEELPRWHCCFGHHRNVQVSQLVLRTGVDGHRQHRVLAGCPAIDQLTDDQTRVTSNTDDETHEAALHV